VWDRGEVVVIYPRERRERRGEERKQSRAWGCFSGRKFKEERGEVKKQSKAKQSEEK
jgi:hypothetical protein